MGILKLQLEVNLKMQFKIYLMALKYNFRFHVPKTYLTTSILITNILQQVLAFQGNMGLLTALLRTS